MFIAVFISAYLCLSHAIMPEPEKYILSFPTMDNPMNITIVSPPEKNYFMLIGDWGAHDEDATDVKVQTAVAQKMISFYNQQKQNGYNLLFVAALGDNFYHSGQNCAYYQNRWLNMYGEIAANHPWLVIMGNHDWGFDDANAMCAWGAPNIRFIDPVTNIPYAANQINADKKGCNPHNYYLPDFGYFYSLNELNFEFIGIDQSTHDCPGGIGGGYGNDKVFKNCGNEKIGCNYLQKIANASEQMMIQRAASSNNSNFIISQHYPSQGSRLLNTFKANRKNNGKNDIIWSIFGHTHKQECVHKNGNVCDEIMTGGGGGCCVDFTLRGFYVIGFDEDGNMIQPLEFNDPAISCEYPCGQQLSANDVIQRGLETCCNTMDVGGIDCNIFQQNKCTNIN
eukprot:399195_1